MVHNLTTACHSVVSFYFVSHFHPIILKYDTDLCTQGGVLSQSSKVTVTVERGTKENVCDVDIPICKKQECPLTQSDCLRWAMWRSHFGGDDYWSWTDAWFISAFYQLPTNAKGIFVNGKGKVPFVRVTSGNCTVSVSFVCGTFPKLIISPIR
jgi:hypothetical protein